MIAAAPPTFWGASALEWAKQHVLRGIRDCGTGAFGYTKLRCLKCGGDSLKPRGCHNRNCPMCVSAEARTWLEKQEEKVLPTSYFHVVFTLPSELRALALASPRDVNGMLMHAAKDTILGLFRDRKPGPSIPAVLQVLHTWNQRMDHHPHVHMVVSGGGYDPHNDRWVPCPNPQFLAPSKELAARFRDTLLTELRAWQRRLPGGEVCREAFEPLLDSLADKRWNVFIKKPFGGPKQVIRYLGRYTHRTAISNARLVALNEQRVTFRFRDRKANRDRLRTLKVTSFLNLFAIHIPPKGFRRIRGAGLLAGNCNARRRLAHEAALRHHNGKPPKEPEPALEPQRPPSHVCPHCAGTVFEPICIILPDAADLPSIPARPPPLPGGQAFPEAA